MSATVAPSLAVQARSAARSAARQADVEVTGLHDIGELTEAAELFVEVWQASRSGSAAAPPLAATARPAASGHETRHRSVSSPALMPSAMGP